MGACRRMVLREKGDYKISQVPNDFDMGEPPDDSNRERGISFQGKGNQPPPSEFDVCTGCPTAFAHL